MKYTTQNNIHIVEVPISDFKIILNDSKKKSASPKNYCNAGFFANFKSNNQPFTLPVAHLVCDYNATSTSTKKYCTERGKFNENKFTYDSSTWSYCNDFHKKSISTLLVNTNSNKAEIKEIISIPTGYNYAISGIPVMRNGSSVNFEKDVQTQGWDGSPLYATWHIFIGLKKDSDIIYVMGMQTTTWNMVKTSEAYQKFKALGMYNVIKLDGGGSFHMNVNGKTVASTSEDRRINTIICFENETKNKTNNNKTNSKVDNVTNNNVDINNTNKIKEENKTNTTTTDKISSDSNINEGVNNTSTTANKSKPRSLLSSILKQGKGYLIYGKGRTLR